MKVAVFIGFLACFNLTTAGVTSLGESFDKIVKEVKEILAQIDPLTVSDLSLRLLNEIDVSLKSISVSGFSKFEFSTLKNGEYINATFNLPVLSTNVDNLNLVIAGKNTLAVPSLDFSVSGLTVDVILSYTTEPLRLTTLNALAQITDLTIKGSLQLNDFPINITPDKDAGKHVNELAVKYQKKISKLILDVVNDILAIADA